MAELYVNAGSGVPVVHWGAGMMKKLPLLLALLLPCSAAAADDHLQDALKKEYQKHALALRSAFQEGDQEFDANGRPLKSATQKVWTIRGPILIQKVSLSKDKLRLEGPRIAFGFTQDKKPKQVAVALSKSIRVEIHLDQHPASVDEVKAIINRVFFPDSEHLVPEYERAGASDTDKDIYHV